MKVELNQKDGLVRELKVEVPAERVNTEINQKLTDFRKKADIKGFRKGKVPMSMIKSLYGEEARAMVADELIKSTIGTAAREKDLRVAATPKLTYLDFNEAGDLLYTAEVEVFPEMAEVTYEGLEVPEARVDVTDSDVDEIAEFYRERFSETRPVTRDVKDGDIVVVDLLKKEDPRGIMEQEKFEGVEIDLSKPQTIAEFKQQLPGMKAGDEKDIRVEYAEDYPDEKFAGANITYHAVVKEVKEKIKPPFDDSLARRSGQAETALELKLKIRKELEQEKLQQEKNKQRGELIHQVSEKNKLPIPEGLVEEYLDSMVEDYKKQFPDADPKEMRGQYRENAETSIRWNLLFHRLAEQEKLEVSQSDVEEWTKGFAESNNVSPEQAREVLARSGRADSIKESILEQKVLDFLSDRAKKVEPR